MATRGGRVGQKPTVRGRGQINLLANWSRRGYDALRDRFVKYAGAPRRSTRGIRTQK